MNGAVWIDGAFVERGDGRISAFDAAVQHGVGLFETMRAVDGRVLWLFEHLDRLNRSARELGLTESVRINALAEAVRRTAERAAASHQGALRIRLTLTGGDLNLRAPSGARREATPTVLIVAQPATERPAALFERGAAVVVAQPRLNPLDPFVGHKTINYWMRLRELQRAASAGCDEALFLQISNHLAGGAVSNLFVVRNGALLTPIARGEEPEGAGALRSPVLPGITRAFVLDTAQAMGVACERRMLSIDDLLGADEAFLTNSGWGVLPLTRVEAAPIGRGAHGTYETPNAHGTPGELTRMLREQWARAAAEEEGH